MQFYSGVFLLRHLQGKGRVCQEDQLSPLVFGQEFLLHP